MKTSDRNRRAAERPAGTAGGALGAAALALSMLAALAAGAGPAQAQDTVASWIIGPAKPAPAAARFPSILDRADIERYRKIFTAQKRGRWAAARQLVRRLDDRILMGHVLAQRYLHPTKYRSRYGELAQWMGRYADHPDAKRIYRLALRRRPHHAKAPARPRSFQGGALLAASAKTNQRRRPKAAGFRRGRAERHVLRHIRHLVRRQRLSAAQKYLDNAKTRRAVGRAGIDRARAIIAGGWFRWGNIPRALALAGAAAKRSGKAAPEAQWWAGLAAFKLHRYDQAAGYFAAAARAPSAGPQEASRAAFWAARANLVGRRPGRVIPWLTRAAANPRTFYGLIAIHMLGGAPTFNWHEPALAAERTTALLAAPAGKRALALIQVGQGRRAERELRPIRNSTEPRHLRAIMALADAAGLPATAYRAAKLLQALMGERIDAALYPIPAWAPNGGYSMDRALVFALARQESAFNARAKSRSGARGLLQLMPATARYMGRRSGAFRGRNRARLFDPEINLALGQKYMRYLLSGDIVAGNMIMMIAAYNGGPGNTAKWQRNMPHGADPLVFMETIPARETRLFVKRVLENLWIYRMRLGQKAPTLDALAGGRWPYYIRLDGITAGPGADRR
ncbi:MAG: lytic transglycosylase domain-containing protein [Alphaproteobacteria bacterium]|nr:MAG: lytic transglycosylase domain-containing protein [Alphaproteobacteria bacterium]